MGAEYSVCGNINQTVRREEIVEIQILLALKISSITDTRDIGLIHAMSIQVAEASAQDGVSTMKWQVQIQLGE